MVITPKREKHDAIIDCFSPLIIKLISKFDIQIIKENRDTERQQSWAERDRQEFFKEENRFLGQQFPV